MRKSLVAVFGATFALVANAASETVGGIRWNYVACDGGVAVFGSSRSVWDNDDNRYETEYTSAIPENTRGAVAIPSTLGGSSVVKIGDGAFDDCEYVTAVEIPSSVVSIGAEAFAGCERLASIEIPESVVSIGYRAFEECDRLRTARVPAALKSQISANSVFWESPVSITYYTSGSGGESKPEDPEELDTPDPVVGESGAFDPAFAKAQTVTGALYDEYGNIAGTVQIKASKLNARKRVVKFSASATLLNGKKVSAKAVTASLAANGTIRAEIDFKDPIDDMDFAMSADGAFSLAGDDYTMKAAQIGKLSNGKAQFILSGTGVTSPAGIIDYLLPDSETFDVVNGKWKFAKAASVKLPRGATTVSVSTDGGKTNLSGLKLTCNAKTGIFKGTFKMFAIDYSGKNPKLKKYTVSISGLVIGGEGVGVATCKSPAVGTWKVTITD